MWSKQYISAVHPVTCSLLWLRCLFDRFQISDSFEIFQLRHPDYDLDLALKLISSSMSWHLSTRKMSHKSMSNLANRQTNRQTDKHRVQSHLPPPLSEVINWEHNLVTHNSYSPTLKWFGTNNSRLRQIRIKRNSQVEKTASVKLNNTGGTDTEAANKNYRNFNLNQNHSQFCITM